MPDRLLVCIGLTAELVCYYATMTKQRIIEDPPGPVNRTMPYAKALSSTLADAAPLSDTFN